MELSREAVGFLCGAAAETLYDAAVDSSSGEVGWKVARVEAAHKAPYDRLQASSASTFQLFSPRPPSAFQVTVYALGDSRPYHAARKPACRVGPATSWGSLCSGGLWVEGPSKCKSGRY